MAHQHQGTGGGFPFPEEQQIAVDFRLFQLFMHEGEELLQQRVEGQELFPLIGFRNADCIEGDHSAQLFGILLRPGIGGRSPVFRLFPRELQRPDNGNAQENEHQGQQAEQNNDNGMDALRHALCSFLKFSQARPMARAPLGRIRMLVWLCREGTRMNSAAIISSGQIASPMFFR